MNEYITPFDKDRRFKDVYAPDEVCQLIYKNCISPDGVTIIGTRDSIENFIDTLDENELVSHGFYEWIKHGYRMSEYITDERGEVHGEIVRCEYCRFFDTRKCKSQWPFRLDGFCAWGERKSEGE